MRDAVQQQRFELKYRVTERTAGGVREFVRGFLVPDEFSRGLQRAYAVYSLYLDSEDLRLYNSTVNGDKNRFKLRLRYYDHADTAPVFFEIKRRVDNSILKRRAAVKRECVEPVLLGETPALRHLIAPDGKQLVHLQEFVRRMHLIRAKPKTLVSYMREAWMSPTNNSVRVTFDREVCATPEKDGDLDTPSRPPIPVFEEHVILELKFTDRMPNWAGEMIQRFGLVQCSAAKYAEGIDLTGERRKLIPRFVDSRPPW